MLQVRHVAAGPARPTTPARLHGIDAVEHDRQRLAGLTHCQTTTGRSKVEIATRRVQALKQRPSLTQHGPPTRLSRRRRPTACLTGQPRFQTARIGQRFGKEKRFDSTGGAALSQSKHLRRGDAVSLKTQQQGCLSLLRRDERLTQQQPPHFGERFPLLSLHQQRPAFARQGRPPPCHGLRGSRRFRVGAETVRQMFAAALPHGRRHAQRLAFQADPRLRLGHRWLSLLADVASRQQAPCPRLDPSDDDSRKDVGTWAGPPVSAQEKQAFARRGQCVVQRRMEGREVALAVSPGERACQSRTLPVEHMDRAFWRGDEKMVGVQVGMAKAGAVQASQRRAKVARDLPPARGIFLRLQEGPQLHPRHLAHQKEGPSLTVLAGRQPFRPANAFALERLQHPRLAEAPRQKAKASQGVAQSRPPSYAMLAFEEGDPARRL
jgi:hypothetical protein